MKNFLLIIFALLLSLSSCQKSGNELTLEDIQRDEVKELYKYQVTSNVGVSTFKSNQVRFREFTKTFQIEARNEGEIISIVVPYLGVGTFRATNLEGVRIGYIDKEGRFFSTDNPKVTSDAVVTITELDTDAKLLNGTFSGTLYDPDAASINDNANRRSIYNGQMFNVKF